MAITVVIPAYNEFEELPRAVAALKAQTLPPDRIVIALNNAKPGLYDVAVATGAEVHDVGHCPNLKAEALNKVMAEILPTLVNKDRIVVCDADSTLAPTWLEVADSHVDDAIVGGVFLGESGGGWLGLAQRNEYQSYAREVYARNDRAWVLTGTGTMFKKRDARVMLNRRGYLYDESVSTEDFELTVAFKRAGYRTISPRGCEVTTEVMCTRRQLHDQRTRWYRGAVETLRVHRFNRSTFPYYAQQAKIVLGLVLSWVAMGLVILFATLGYLTMSWWWSIAIIPVLSKIVGGQHRWFSAAVLPELIYDLLLQRALIVGWWQAMNKNKNRVWNATEGA